MMTGKALGKNHSQPKLIRSPVDLRLFVVQLFRCRIGWSSRAHLREPTGKCRLVQHSNHAEVCQHRHCRVRSEKNVGWFDIAVDKASLMQMTKNLRKPNADDANNAWCQD